MTVAFFGHKDTPESIYPLLVQEINRFVEQYSNLTFLVGTHGSFDRMVQRALCSVKDKYRHIGCYIVLAYLKTEKKDSEQYALPTVFPEGLENVPLRYAISRRNEYMVSECDAVICYIEHDWGGAAKYVCRAVKSNKAVKNLYETDAKNNMHK